ncbi:MAG: hypothetical protein IJ151_03315 [Bacteroidales bacterium]|nr:hypothetical protein [Bacteroidales bacterium]
MKLINYFAPLAGALILLSASCNKETVSLSETSQAGDANVTLSISSALNTRAVSPDAQLNTADIFIFDVNPSSRSYGMVEAYKKVTSSEIQSASNATVNLTVSAGLKHIYVLANADESIAPTILKEPQLRELYADLKDCTADNLLMIGAAEETVAAGSTNNIEIACRRLVSRISFGQVKCDISSEAFQALDFRLEGVYLMNVPKRVRIVNGDSKDVFGTSGSTLFKEGSTGYPAGFVAAMKDASTKLPYYKYEEPNQNRHAADGLYNGFDTEFFRDYHWMPLDTPAKDLTQFIPAAEDRALNPNKTINVNKNFYTYPNSCAPSTDITVADRTTKLIVEALIHIENEADRRYYYPISIPYTQPNYYYRIDKLIIKRLGSPDPSLPVTTAQCSVKVTVMNWHTGQIVGEFNNETTTGTYEY